MSIIQEALKKAQGDLKGSSIRRSTAPERISADSVETAPAKSEAPIRVSQSAKKAALSRQDPKAVAILILILIATAYLAASQLFGHKKDADKLVVPAQAAPFGRPSTQDSSYKAFGITDAKAAKSENLSSIQSIVFQQHEEKAVPAYPDYVLNGIMYIEGAPRAIVNNSMVEIGDNVNGAQVLKIEKRRVVLQHNDAEITLNLK